MNKTDKHSLEKSISLLIFEHIYGENWWCDPKLIEVSDHHLETTIDIVFDSLDRDNIFKKVKDIIRQNNKHLKTSAKDFQNWLDKQNKKKKIEKERLGK